MTYTKKYFLYLICIISFTLQTYNIQAIPAFGITTLPKAGTHLLVRCVNLITGKHTISPIFNAKKESRQQFRQKKWLPSLEFLEKCLQTNPDEYPLMYVRHTEEYAQFFRSRIKLLTIFRDPRDQLISRVHWMRIFPDFKYKTENTQELILSFIGYPNQPFLGMKSWIPQLSTNKKALGNIAQLYQEYLPWMQERFCYAARFENLVGPKGGGTKEAQIKEIKNIAHHLGITLSNARINEIADQLFGHGYSFRKGQIGSWKNYFTQEHTKQFKKVAGQLLINLGYETDIDW